MRSLAAIAAIALASCGGTNDDGADGSTAAASTQRVLQVDYEVQQTSYWCGPASTRIALSARKHAPSQATLAQQLGTTGAGTNSINQVTSVLNRNLGSHVYESHPLPDAPPSAAEEAELWNDIVTSIDQNFPVVANIVAPASNHPPGYPNYTIYHYFTVIGYDASGGRRVYIADPASFSGHRLYWLSFHQLATLIPPKGYSAGPSSAPDAAEDPGSIIAAPTVTPE